MKEKQGIFFFYSTIIPTSICVYIFKFFNQNMEMILTEALVRLKRQSMKVL